MLKVPRVNNMVVTNAGASPDIINACANIKSKAIGTPRIESDEFLMAVGSARTMEDAARIAFYELILWLEQDFGIDRMTGYQLCSQVSRVRLANMVDIQYSVVAKFPKKYLP